MTDNVLTVKQDNIDKLVKIFQRMAVQLESMQEALDELTQEILTIQDSLSRVKLLPGDYVLEEDEE